MGLFHCIASELPFRCHLVLRQNSENISVYILFAGVSGMQHESSCDGKGTH